MDSKGIRSSPSSQRIWEHDVFLSFSGEDTRYNFTDHLFAALQRKGIFTFRDDIKVQKGEAISPQLQKAIEKTRIFIVVFSKNYARSTWCLEELATIADCINICGKSSIEGNKLMEQTILPIFYDIDPSEVRKQGGSYEKAFTDLEIRFKESLEKVQRWRAALTKVANISGWHVHRKPESEVIDDIVEWTISKLGHKFSSLTDDLVGIEPRANALESLLYLSLKHDIRVVGICGMGGIGKTTLAATVYDRISHQYDACSFLADVSKVSKANDLVSLQEQLLRETFKVKNVKIPDLYSGTRLISTRLSHLKTLVVIDNVDHSNQLEHLAGKPNWFGIGSRIIITSRNEHILRQYGVHEVYMVELLNDNEVLELLCRKAFKKDKPMRDYEELTYRVLGYVKGLPLATKVLGSYLFGRSVSEWTSALDRLQKSPEPEIMDVLRTSVDGLVELEREIFLDIACFFNQKKVAYVRNVLQYRGFHPEIGIRDLVDRSLITIFRGKYIRMHDLLQELGKKIVQENSPNEPEKWSRLWSYKDFKQVMMRNKETKHVEAIVVELKHREETHLLGAEALSKMSRLRMLILHNVNLSGGLNSLSNELKYISWEGYPFIYMPSSFRPTSKLRQLWKGMKPFHNLRSMNLTHSRALVETPDFSRVPNLEKLNLEGCTKLSQVHQSICLLHRLSHLNLRLCENLINLPDSLSSVSSLQSLYLSCCFKIKRTPNFKGLTNLEELDLRRCTSLSEVDESIAFLTKLEYLNLNYCKNLVRIPPSVFNLSSLASLYITGCSKVVNQFEKTTHAKELNRNETTRQSTPCIVRKTCKPIGLPLASFFALASSLIEVDLGYCNICEVPDSLGALHCLKCLYLDGNNFITLPCSLKNLYNLTYLRLDHCKNLETLPELPLRIRDSSISRRYLRMVDRGGLYLFNCPKLAKKIESCSSLALSWVARLFQDPNIPNTESSICLIIPGNEIPWWFKHQSSSPSIRIHVPPNLQERDSNWFGLAFGVTFVPHDSHPPVNDDGFMKSMLHCHLNEENDFCIALHAVKRQVTVELEHLWLIHLWWHHDCFEKIQEASFINVEFAADPGLEVKKCGFRWVYKDTVKRFKPRVKHCESNNMQINDPNDDLGIGDSISTLFAGSENCPLTREIPVVEEGDFKLYEHTNQFSEAVNWDKDILPNGKEIVVTRLSKSSNQGSDDLRNEVILIAKLQHRNHFATK